MPISQQGVGGTPKTDLIKKLTQENMAQKSEQPTLSFKPKAPNTIAPMDVSGALSKPASEVKPFQPLGETPDTTTNQGILEAGAQQQRTVINQLIEKMQGVPGESTIEQFKRMREEQGRPKLIETRDETFKQVQNMTRAIANLEESIASEGSDVGTLTTTQLGRVTGKEGREMTRRLEALNDSLSLQNMQVQDVDNYIDRMVEMGQDDRAAEINRLKELASISGLTPDEKELVSARIAKELAQEQAVALTQAERQETLDSGIEEMRKLAVKEGILTSKFAGVIEEAQARLDAGEDPRTIVADVSAAVLANPVLQQKFELARLKAARTSSGSGGGGSGSSSFGDFGLSDKEVNEINAALSLGGQQLIDAQDEWNVRQWAAYQQMLGGESGGGATLDIAGAGDPDIFNSLSDDEKNMLLEELYADGYSQEQLINAGFKLPSYGPKKDTSFSARFKQFATAAGKVPETIDKTLGYIKKEGQKPAPQAFNIFK